jgi:hypothetical protein
MEGKFALTDKKANKIKQISKDFVARFFLFIFINRIADSATIKFNIFCQLEFTDFAKLSLHEVKILLLRKEAETLPCRIWKG